MPIRVYFLNYGLKYFIGRLGENGMKYRGLRRIIGSNIKYYRFLIGFTQEELAEKTELSPRYISDIENARGNISIDTLELISRALKVKPESLFKEINSKKLPKRVNMRK